MTPDEFAKEFYFDPSVSRAMGYGTHPSLVRDKTGEAVAVTIRLLDRTNKMPTDKWLWVQLQPVDALALAGAILAHAKAEAWPIPSNLLEVVERTQFSDKSKAH